MIDVHNHLQDSCFDGIRDQLVETMLSIGIEACAVNGTSEQDWPVVASLARIYPNFVIPSFGLHPWYVSQRSSKWLSSLETYLHEFPTAAIGECGLDRWMKNPDLDDQHAVFRNHLILAQQLQRPITIHCLKAWGPLLDELQSFKRPPKILLHSYGGSLEFARQLSTFDLYFSFSGYFLQPHKESVRQTFTRLPPERILVETDAPHMAPPVTPFSLREGNHPANLQYISQQLGELTQLPQSTFTKNSRKFFEGHFS